MSIFWDEKRIVRLFKINQMYVYGSRLTLVRKQYESRHEKPVFGVCDKVQHKPGCSITGNGKMLEFSDKGSEGILLHMWRDNGAQLICALLSHMQKLGFLMTHIIQTYIFVRGLKGPCSFFFLKKKNNY